MAAFDIARAGPVFVGFVLASLSIAGYVGSRPPRAISSLTAAPLAWAPFYHRGVAALDAGDEPAGGALLGEALRRHPRSPAVRVALLRQALAAGLTEEAFDQLDQLERLDPGTAATALDTLARAVDSADHAAEMRAALLPHPSLVRAFLRAMIAAGKPAELIAGFCRGLPASMLADAGTRALVVNQLVRAGDYAAARRLLTENSIPSLGIVDPRFDIPGIPPPFGWQLASGPFGAASRAQGRGLDVVAYGRGDGVLASQLLTLTPGVHVVRLQYRPTGDGAGALRLRLRCAPPGPALGSAPLDGRDVLASLSFTAAVPPTGCAGQYLELVASGAADPDSTQQARLIRIDLRPAR